MSGQTASGVGLAVILVLVAWLVLALGPDQFEQLNQVLPTASAMLGLGVAAVGAVGGTKDVIAGHNIQQAAPSGLLVLGGSLLTIASLL